MQAGMEFLSSPITAVERVAGDDIESRSHREPRAVRQYQQQGPGHGLRQAQEEIEIQIRRRMVRPISPVVAFHEDPPVGTGRLVSTQPAKFDSRLAHLAPLLADFLELVVVHARLIIVDISDTLVAPLDLNALPQ